MCAQGFILTGCEKKKETIVDDNAPIIDDLPPAPDTEENTVDYKKHPEKYFSKEEAMGALRDYFGNEDGINFNYLDTVIVSEDGEKNHYYKFDVRKYNEGGVNSRLDIYYIIVSKYGGGIYDSATFKDKFGVEQKLREI